LTSAGNQKVDWVTGLYYFQQQLDNTTFSLYGDTADAFYLYNVPSVRTLIANGQSNILNNRDSYAYGTTETKSSALFGQSTWHATPKLDITTGARVT
ncbi:TonB-dependent receptor, partial [Acinetobacter baumannii]